MIHATLQDSSEWLSLDFTLKMLWNVEGSSYTSGSHMTVWPSNKNSLKLRFIHDWSESAGTTAHQKNLCLPLPRILCILDHSQLKRSESPEENKRLHGRNSCRVAWEEVVSSNIGNKMQGSKPKQRLIQNSHQLISGIYHANRRVKKE